MMLDDVLDQGLEPGRNVLVVGGDQNGMLIADCLADRGSRVTVAEAHGHFAQKLAGHHRWYLLNRQNEKGVEGVKHVHGLEVDDNDDVWLKLDAGPRLLEGVDTIVFASRSPIGPDAGRGGGAIGGTDFHRG
jgi:pyruvate/2-oxoglutarate dehydrogenase complex dihydrolipoamide dehydrogenase (E3) component